MMMDFILLITFAILGVTQGDVSEFSSFPLHEFESFAHMYLVKVKVTQLTQSMEWNLTTTTNHESCKAKEVIVYLQYAGYPIVALTPKSFPPKYVTSRHQSYHQTYTTTNKERVLHIQQPLQGDWYMAVTLPHAAQDIRQAGLTSPCRPCEYSLEASVDMDVYLFDCQDAIIFSLGWVLLDDTLLSAIVTLTNCSDPCNVTIAVRSGSAPLHDDNLAQKTCTTPDCSLHLISPPVSRRLVILVINNEKVDTVVQFLVTAHTSEPDVVIYPYLEAKRSIYGMESNFGRRCNGTHKDEIVDLTGDHVTVVPFLLTEPSDIGGTLVVGVSHKVNNSCKANVSMYLNHASIYLPVLTTTNATASLSVNLTDTHTQEVYIPYPQSGHWFITLAYDCTNLDSCCKNVTLTLDVAVTPCFKGHCQNGGECARYISSLTAFTACHCIAGWEGYDCTDDTHVRSNTLQLLEVLLLTMSNLFFIPAIIIAIRRKYYTEAIVYFCNMFFSSFYHACDVEWTTNTGCASLRMCSSQVNALSYADFFCSIMSLWVTIVAVTEYGVPWKTMLQITGIMVIQFGVIAARHSLWVIAAPTATGMCLVFATWIWKCRRTHKCYPTRVKYWLSFGVGGVFAVVGVSLFSFVETTDNYYYVHSMWHMCMATCIPFVLPWQPERPAIDELGDSTIVYQRLMAEQSTDPTPRNSSIHDSGQNEIL